MSTPTGTQSFAPLPPVPPVAAPSRQSLTREYVSGSSQNWYANLPRALPWAIDDVSTDFGDSLYARMLLDAQVAACIAVFKASILEDGMTITPAVTDKDNPDYEQAVAIQEDAEQMLGELVTPLDDVLWNMEDALAFGHKLAEIKWEQSAGLTGRRQLRIVDLKVKPRRSTAFVVDAYLNIVGIMGAIPGQGLPVLLGTIAEPDSVPNLLPRERFFVYAWRPVDGDPRGTSMLRSSFAPWNRKVQLLGDYMAFMSQYASPSLVGFTPPNAVYQPATDPYGNPDPTQTALTPEQAMVASLTQFRNSSAAAFPNGASVQVVQSSGSGDAFMKAFALCDTQITKAILTQQLATEEGEHMSRAAASIHQDVLDTLVRQGKRSLVTAFRRDVLRQWVRYNYGDRAAQLLTPACSLGEVEAYDRASMWTAAAALNNAGWFHDDTQLAEMDIVIGVPQRDLTQPPSDVPQPVPPQLAAQAGADGQQPPPQPGEPAAAEQSATTEQAA